MADEPLTETELDEGGEPADDSDRLVELHKRAMERFDAVAMPQAEMRAQSLQDRRFLEVEGAMWEGPFAEQWENAPRPEVDMISGNVEKVELDYRQNRMIANYLPVGDTSDDGTAKTLDGMFRADAYHFKASQAWDNAFSEALRGGFGAWRLSTDYADPYDPDSDAQRVNPGIQIVDADQSVYFDNASTLYDASDAKWAFIITADPRALIEKRWGDVQSDFAPPQLQWQYEWFAPDVIRIAEYYEVEEAADKLWVFSNKLTEEEQRFFATEMTETEARKLIAQGWSRRIRSVKRRRVHKYILSGSQVLKDCGYIAGSCIPIVPVYGRRSWVDKQPRWRGYVRKRKDAQRIFNSGMGKVVESDSRAPYPVPVFAPEQVSEPAIQEQWARANIDRLPYLLAAPVLDENGHPIQTGPVATLEPPQVPPTTATLLQISMQILKGDDDNTDQVQANVSGDAMEQAKATVDAKSGIFIDNAKQSHQRGAEIWLEQGREVYYEAGRKLDTLSEDGQDGQIELSEPHLDPTTQVYSVRNDLSAGKYKVVADVQEATATRRAKTVKESLNIAAVMGQLENGQDIALAAGLTAMMQMDGEGMSDLQTFARHKAIGVGLTKPTKEEQAEIDKAQASQGQGQPTPADQALMATAGAQQAQAGKFAADARKSDADAVLKLAQAHALGGPEEAPKVPTGLDHANDAADVTDKLAGADLKRAQAAQIVHGIHTQKIKTGAQLLQEEHDREMARRQQDHVESQPQQSVA